MGTHVYWCPPSPNNYIIAEHGEAVSLSHAVSLVEQYECETHTSMDTPRKTVPVGSDFQAELPILVVQDRESCGCSDVKSDSPRWIMEQTWHQQGNAASTSQAYVSSAPVVSCSCSNRHTVECVKLNIEECRKALKNELGETYYLWGFDEMGEIVSEDWSDDDELAFHELVRRKPLSFWRDVQEVFPSRSMAEVVSYYFNVYVLRRRAVQNRFYPDHIDSDDDEMVLDIYEKFSDTMIDSYEDDEESQVESQVDDALCDDEEDSSCMSWPLKESGPGELQRSSVLHEGLDLVTAVPDSICLEQSLRAGHGHEHSKTGITMSSEYHDTTVQGGSTQIKSWDILTWNEANHITSSHSAGVNCQGQTWSSSTIVSSQDDVDKLISTTGMIEEFFGSDVTK